MRTYNFEDSVEGGVPSLLPRNALTWNAFSPLRCASGIALTNSFSSGRTTFVCGRTLFSVLRIRLSAVSSLSTPNCCPVPEYAALGRPSATVQTIASGTASPLGGRVTPSLYWGIIQKLNCRWDFSGTGRHNTCSARDTVIRNSSRKETWHQIVNVHSRICDSATPNSTSLDVWFLARR